MSLRAACPAGAGDGLRPGARRAHHRAGLRRPLRGRRGGRRRRCCCGSRRRSARRTSPSSWRPTPATRSRASPGVRATSASSSRTTSRGARSTPPSRAGRASRTPSPARRAGELDALRELFQRKALRRPAGPAAVRRCPTRRAARLGELSGPDAARCRALRRELGIDASDDAPAFVRGDGTPVGGGRARRASARTASLTALSLETNGGMCRDLLRVRYPDRRRREEVAA